MTKTVLTAWRQELTRDENISRMNELNELLKVRRFNFEKTEVIWGGFTEPAFRIDGLNLENALILGKQFKQEAITYNGQIYWIK